MLKSWRAWVLILLFFGPILAYTGLGFLWLLDRGWVVATVAGFFSFGTGVAFAILAARWTRTAREILPPIDWSAPSTFAPVDRAAWALVQAEAEKGDSVPMETLSGADVYIDTGRHLANRLAKHYHPMAEDPIDRVPVIELLTALELAAEDLNGLCRQVPGGDLITPGHWKTAVQAANYLTRANNIYSYLLPLFNPITGLPRLASQHLMVKPAWKTMQGNLLKWFYQAYVNRLGVHLIELYSGRLVIGAEQYRRLTRKMGRAPIEPAGGSGPLRIAVAGARDSGHAKVVGVFREAGSKDEGGGGHVVLARLKGAGVPGEALDRLIGADWVEVHGYTAKPDRESARDRSTRRDALGEATDVDLLVLVIDDRRGTLAADAAFAADWDRWYVERPTLERPPVLAAMITADGSRLEAARSVLPPTIGQVVALDPSRDSPVDLAAALLPAIAAELPRAERASILRHLHHLSTRSSAGRLVRQVGEHGRTLLGRLRRPKPPEPPAADQASGRPEVPTKA